MVVTDEHVTRVTVRDEGSGVLAQAAARFEGLAASKGRASTAAIQFSTNERKVEGAIRSATIQAASFATSLQHTKSGLELAATGVGFLSNAFGSLTGPIGLVVLAVGTIAQGILLFTSRSKETKEATTRLKDALGDLTETFGKAQSAFQAGLLTEAQVAAIGMLEKRAREESEVAKRQDLRAKAMAGLLEAEAAEKEVTDQITAARRRLRIESDFLQANQKAESETYRQISADLAVLEGKLNVAVGAKLRLRQETEAGLAAAQQAAKVETVERGAPFGAFADATFQLTQQLITMDAAIQRTNVSLDLSGAKWTEFKDVFGGVMTEAALMVQLQAAMAGGWEQNRAEIERLTRAIEILRQVGRNQVIEGANAAAMEAQRASKFGANANAMIGLMGDLNEQTFQNFEVNKAAAAAEAAVNTYVAVTKALAQGGIFGAAMGAGLFLLGMAQVANILSATPGGAARGSVGGGSTGGGLPASGGTGAGPGTSGSFRGTGAAGEVSGAPGTMIAHFTFQNVVDRDFVQAVFDLARRWGFTAPYAQQQQLRIAGG